MRTQLPGGNKTLRSVLLGTQFGITSIMIICSMLIYDQLQFLKDKDLGIKTDQMLVIDYGPSRRIANNFETIKNTFSSISGVKSVTFSSHVPGEIPNGVTTEIVDTDGQVREGDINLTLIDYDFIDNYGIELVAGQGFSAHRLADSESFDLILNESAVAAYGFDNPEDIIGKSFRQWGGNGTVVGVVKDFNYRSLHEKVGLLSFKMWPDQYQKISLDLSTAELQKTINELESTWSSLYPDVPFNYYFADDKFQAQYENDTRFSTIISSFTVISLLIGILGLVAFANFWCQRRKKEISIRKVLGADFIPLVWKLYFGFSKPVMISFLVGIPVALYFGNLWLRQFAYRMDFGLGIILKPLLIIIIFTWIAVGMQTVRTVISNPAHNLKED